MKPKPIANKMIRNRLFGIFAAHGMPIVWPDAMAGALILKLNSSETKAA